MTACEIVEELPVPRFMNPLGYSFIFQFGVFSSLSKVVLLSLDCNLLSTHNKPSPLSSPSVPAASIAMIYYVVVYVSVYPNRLQIPQGCVSFGFFSV